MLRTKGFYPYRIDDRVCDHRHDVVSGAILHPPVIPAVTVQYFSLIGLAASVFQAPRIRSEKK